VGERRKDSCQAPNRGRQYRSSPSVAVPTHWGSTSRGGVRLLRCAGGQRPGCIL